MDFAITPRGPTGRRARSRRCWSGALRGSVPSDAAVRRSPMRSRCRYRPSATSCAASGLGRLPSLTVRPPIVRYERERPGELLHIDAKKLGRIVVVGHRITGDRAVRGPRRRTGWETLHVAIDDCSRVAYAELLPDETAASAVVFLAHAVAWLATLGVRVEAVMTDNAFCYVHRQYATAIAALGLRHLRTRPYTPRTNGKAERFIQTALREWAYAKPYRSSRARAGALGPFLTSYNTTRPHTAHDRKPPISRLSA